MKLLFFKNWSGLTYLKTKIFFHQSICFIHNTYPSYFGCTKRVYHFILLYFTLFCFLSKNTTCCRSCYAINYKHRQEGWRWKILLDTSISNDEWSYLDKREFSCPRSHSQEWERWRQTVEMRWRGVKSHSFSLTLCQPQFQHCVLQVCSEKDSDKLFYKYDWHLALNYPSNFKAPQQHESP